MVQVHIEQVGQGIYEHIPTEDVVGYVLREHSLLAWAIDGASTLTESPFTTFADLTDAGWFARQLSSLFEQRFQHVPFSVQQLREGLDELRRVYLQAGGNVQPLWAWPVAAATVVEVDFSVIPMQVICYRYADCFVATWHSEPTPEKTAVVSSLVPVYDSWKPFSGFEGPQLDRLWQRREQQQNNQSSSALTLNPESALNATLEQGNLHAPGHILVGSDGLSRVWDTYQLMTLGHAQDLVMQQGLPALLNVLRAFEADNRTGDAGLKRRDDASGIHLFLG